jgi:hypothetical protein
LTSRPEKSAPSRCAWRSPSDANASTIQKVVVSVRSANQAMVPLLLVGEPDGVGEEGTDLIRLIWLGH